MEYSPTSVRGYLLGGVFLIASVAGVLTLFVAVSQDSTPALVIAGGCGVLAVVASWALASWKPTVVSIREGVLDVERGDHTERFELTDPSTVVEFNGKPGSPTWTAMIKRANGPRTILRSNQVKPRQFERIVRHHRAAKVTDDATGRGCEELKLTRPARVNVGQGRVPETTSISHGPTKPSGPSN